MLSMRCDVSSGCCRRVKFNLFDSRFSVASYFPQLKLYGPLTAGTLEYPEFERSQTLPVG